MTQMGAFYRSEIRATTVKPNFNEHPLNNVHSTNVTTEMNLADQDTYSLPTVS